MNQKELSFFYRGVLLLIVGGLLLLPLSSINQQWARYVETIGGVILFLGGAGFTTFVTFRGFIRFIDAPIPDEPISPALYMDRWIYIARLAIAASVLLAVIFVATLLFVQAPRQCPNWHLPDRQSSPSLWVPFFMSTMPLLVAMIFVGVRWRWIVRKAIESTDYPTTVPIPYMLIATVFGGCAMAQFPWVLLLSRCLFGT